MSASFDGVLWSVEVPEGWIVKAEENCAMFCADPPLGALHISSARKEATTVSDEDLKEFASGRVPQGVGMKHVAYGPFSGFSAEYQRAEHRWTEWWLRAGHLMIYATYNVVEGKQGLEADEIERMLNSLKPAI